MMKYQCDRGHLFLHIAKQVHFLEAKEINIDEDTNTKVMDTIEASCCPFCFSKFISEIEAEPVVGNVESVYIYELTTGPQTALDALLAQGYVITNRYAKAYHLEKPKAVESPQEAEDKFTEQARTYYTKLQNQKAEAPLP